MIQALAPSFNFPRPTITDGTDTVRPATLRGLGPDQVLVLINGKRRHQSALVHINGSIGRGSTGVDLNAIPVSAIEHIEILRDGAAAQYGSDAIAGVINIVLKCGAKPVHADRCKAGGNSGSFTEVYGNRARLSDGGTFDTIGCGGIEDRPRDHHRRRRIPRPQRHQPRGDSTRATRSSPAMPATTPCRSRTPLGRLRTRATS